MEIREIQQTELPTAAAVFLTALGEELGDASLATWIGYLEMSRNVGGYVGDRLVGTATQYPAEVTVPGGASVPVHAVTGVGVLPTHKRRGIGRGMMQDQIVHAASSGAVALVLEASESTIYGKFGFGPATVHENAVIRSEKVRFIDDVADDGSFEFAQGEAIAHYAVGLFDAWRLTRPGQMSRPAHLWGLSLVDPAEWRGGASALQWVFHLDAAGTPDGYVAYRTQHQWDGSMSAMEARINEIVAPEPRVRRLLLQFVAGLDLVAFVNINGLPTDDPLVLSLHNSRQLKVPDRRDGLWVRLVDVPRALQAREWWAQDTLVFEVVDPDVDAVAGRWSVAVADGRAVVTRTTAAADVTLGVAELGMLWLGGGSAVQLAGAGRLTGTPDAVARTSVLFRGIEAPTHTGEF